MQAEKPGGTPKEVDSAPNEALADRANALYANILDQKMDFEEDTAGQKNARDNAKSVTG